MDEIERMSPRELPFDTASDLSPLLQRCHPAVATHIGLTRGGGARSIFLPANSRARREALNVLVRGRNVLIAQVLAAFKQPSARPTQLVELITRYAGHPSSFTAMALGSGPWRKDVVLLIDRDRPIAVAKVAVTEASSELVANEARWLRELGQCGALSKVIPEITECGELEARNVLIQRILPGRRPRMRLDSRIALLVSKIQGCAPVTRGFAGSPMQAALRDRQQRLNDRMPRRWQECFSSALKLLEKEIACVRLPMVLAHRDFAPWNLRETPYGVGAFDWELAHPGWVPLYDLFHYRLMPVALERDLMPEDAQYALSDVSEAAAFLGASSEKREAADLQLLAYLLDVYSLYIDSHNGNVCQSGVVVVRYKSLIERFAEWRSI